MQPPGDSIFTFRLELHIVLVWVLLVCYGPSLLHWAIMEQWTLTNTYTTG